ncbi:hypothetical protein JVU11DRAFT_10252 [Chiua virens]|nr:hypothetical protein JVU11DRAFT_10252 [Chiua virens]
MTMIHDARSDSPLLNDAFDVSHYPIVKSSNARASTKLYQPRRRGRGRTSFTNHGPPSKAERHGRPRNVSEPQLVSSTNCVRESWLTNFPSARTVGDIAHLGIDDDIRADTIRYSQSAAAICDRPDSPPPCDVDDDDLQKTPRAFYEDVCGISRHVEVSDGDGESEEESLYSMDSADQEVHPLLLSMPVIPQIKLERKATVRKPDPGPLLNDARNRTFLSPRIRDLRTPLRMSSRRYGRVLPRTNSPVEDSDTPLAKAHNDSSSTPQTSRLAESVSGSGHLENRAADLENMHSVSEPTLNSGNPSDDEQEPLLKKEIDESTHSDMLLSPIEEVDTSPEPTSDGSDEALKPKQGPLKRTKRSHQRSSLAHSISLSSILHAVADGCASLDILHRKQKTKPEPVTEPRFEEPVTKTHNLNRKWASKDGQIVIKVFVPSTDDIWMFRVPQDIDLADFTSRVATKLGFTFSFSGSLWNEPKYHFRTDEQFNSWVKGRIRFGRNLPIVAHVLVPLPLVRLSVDVLCITTDVK